MVRTRPAWVALLAFACQGDAGVDTVGGEQVLARATGWTHVAEPAWTGERAPDDAGCSDAGLQIEDGNTEILTDLCRWASLSQPALVNGRRRSVVRGFLYHSALIAEASEAHVAIGVADELLWEARVPIPAIPGGLTIEAELPVNVRVGDPVHLHLHNHGANAWTMFELVLVSR